MGACMDFLVGLQRGAEIIAAPPPAVGRRRLSNEERAQSHIDIMAFSLHFNMFEKGAHFTFLFAWLPFILFYLIIPFVSLAHLSAEHLAEVVCVPSPLSSDLKKGSRTANSRAAERLSINFCLISMGSLRSWQLQSLLKAHHLRHHQRQRH